MKTWWNWCLWRATNNSVCYPCSWSHMGVRFQNLRSMSSQTSIWTSAMAPFLIFCELYRYRLLSPIPQCNEVHIIITLILEMRNWGVSSLGSRYLFNAATTPRLWATQGQKLHQTHFGEPITQYHLWYSKNIWWVFATWRYWQFLPENVLSILKRTFEF